MRSRALKLLFCTILFAGGLFFSSWFMVHGSWSAPRAQALEVGINAVGEEIQLTATDPRVIIARIIRVALGLLGAVTIVLILYGGFVWMTAGGNEENIAKAKKILTNASIGLIIILTSFAITQFVLSRLIAATTGGAVGGGGVGAGGVPGGLPSGAFVISSINPQNPAPPPGYPRNSVVRVRLNQSVDGATVPDNVTVHPAGSATPVVGTFTVAGTLIQFVPTAACPAPNDDRFCFDADTTFVVEIAGGLRSNSGRFVSCGGLAPNCSVEFAVGNYIDTEEPEVAVTVPSDGQSIPRGFQTIRAIATDDSGVSEAEFFDGPTSLGVDSPATPTLEFDASFEWETGSLSPQSCHAITALARDVDTNETTSRPVSVVIRPAHCFDGVQNNGETGLDCGGDLAADPDTYCGKCAGEACSGTPTSCAEYCRSASCVGGICVDLPRIDGVAPLAAGPGSYVTITGEFFGASPGTVTFLGADTPDDDVTASLASCAEAWSPTQIIAVVPETAVEGPLMVQTGIGTDTTADDRGFIGVFEPNETLFPGLCAIRPTQGQIGANFTLTGTGFGPGPAPVPGDVVQFDDRVVTIVSGWGPASITGQVPAIDAGPAEIRVTVSGQASNLVTYTVLGPEADSAPVITAITPADGPPETYVTVSGANFGSIVGQVVFTNPTTGARAFGSIDFPEGCSEDFWRNDQVTVKVPETYAEGTDPASGADLAGSPLAEEVHSVTVRRVGINEGISNAVNFTVTTGTPPPGICGLTPASGPEGTEVRFFGEGFVTALAEMAADFWPASVPATPVTAVSDDREEVRAEVPVGSETGPARVTVSGASSNPRDFRVFDCRAEPTVCALFGADFQCCSDGTCAAECAAPGEGGYAWYFSTGPVPQVPRLLFSCAPDTVPTPAPYANRTGGDVACVNALVTGRFSVPMDLGTLDAAGNYQFRSCTGTPGTPRFVCTADVPSALGTFEWAEDPVGGCGGADEPPCRHGFTLTPAALLPDTWYEVKLATGIRGSVETGNAPLEEDAANCGVGFAYCWLFKTRATALPCELAALLVEPSQRTATAVNERTVYNSFGVPEGDICTTVNLVGYDFDDWTATSPAGHATIAAGIPADLPDGPYRGEDKATTTALFETVGNPDGPVDITARIPSEDVEDTVFLTIDFTDPEVREYWPNCEQACVNAGIGARFNTDMDPTTFAGALSVLECANESCLAFAGERVVQSVVLESDPDCVPPPGGECPNLIMRVNLEDPDAGLEPNTFYRVILSGDVQSTSGVSLTHENYFGDFSWIFRTKSSDAPCAIASVEVAPSAATVSVVGARVPYRSIPHGSPDECSAEGQELVATSYGWSWAVGEAAVARFLVGDPPAGTLDTTADLPVGCSALCLNTGARGVFGEDGVCGNGIVCDSDADCRTGEVCADFGQCIEAAVGEECDDGNAFNGDGCSNICTNEGTDREGAPWGAVCGNGGSCLTPADCGAGEVCDLGSLTCVEYGEDCDDGKQCSVSGAVCGSDGDCPLIGGVAQTCDLRGGDGCDVRCRSEGSLAGAAECGNGSIGIGEDCDDGNTVGGDGCSSRCLREGSRPEPLAVCGNGIPEFALGEECDGGPGCDPVTCLHTGTSVCRPPLPSGAASCCGNNAVDAGEDCDLGDIVNGDGCSSRCLAEGASPFYPVPSFCGDGAVETGEECEAPPPGGDGRIDPSQVAEAVGAGTVIDGVQMTDVNTEAESVAGRGTFALQCGFSNDSECRDPATGEPAPGDFGIAESTCCEARPRVTDTEPASDEGDVCRNPLIRVDFGRQMNIGSFTGNVLVAREDAGLPCPTGQTPLVRDNTEESRDMVFVGLWGRVRGFFDQFILGARAAHAPPARPPAGTWCTGGAVGRVYGIQTDEGSSLFFQLQGTALDPQSWYRVRVIGDTPGDDRVDGVRSLGGVGLEGNYEWQFHTGDEICAVDLVTVTDTALSPGLFTESDEAHPFTAEALTLRGAIASSIVPIAGVYDWAWQEWQSSAEDIVTVGDVAAADVNPNTGTVTADNKNGDSTVSVSLKITADTLSVPSTAEQVVRGALPVTVFLCENPGLVVNDRAGGNVTVGANPAQPYGNFITRFCRDAGEEDTTADDLPDFTLQSIPAPPGTVIKEFLIRCPAAYREVCGDDVIGFRMIENPQHFSAARWYAAQGFTGNPKALTVDGYEAVRDGRTVYVHAANRATTGSLRSNIYIISYNESARPETLAIYEQILANLRFNVDLLATENTGFCSVGAGTLTTIVHCSADLDCPAPRTCLAQKEKIRRDTDRLADFRDIEAALVATRTRTGSFPTLQAGTFIRAVSTSTWPSWLETLSSATGFALPQDPLNRFADCPDGFDDATCFNTTTTTYQCPSGSHIYQFRSVGPSGYQLETDLEYADALWSPALAPLPLNPEITLNARQGPPLLCTGGAIGDSGLCGDGIRDPDDELCEIGETSTIACTRGGNPGEVPATCDSSCGAFVPNAGSCVNVLGQIVDGNAAAAGVQPITCTSDAPCLTSGATCNNCTVRFCGDGVIQPPEVCDDGANNGRYGYCAASCGIGGGAFGPYCGDNQLAGVEECDIGVNNGRYDITPASKGPAGTCAWDCSYPGPYCGDGVIQVGNEQCDGNTVTKRGQCSNNAATGRARVCDPETVAADCGSLTATCVSLCPSAYRWSLTNISDLACDSAGEVGNAHPVKGVCTEYPQFKTQTCDMTNPDACTIHTPTENPLTCQPLGACGNGITEGSEQCDDGNPNNNDGCTNACRNNVCGDGVPWIGVEACDFGAANGVPCAAPFGGTCNYCATNCTFVTNSGAFCGDGIYTPPGPPPAGEVCDPTAPKRCSNNPNRACTTNANCTGGGICLVASERAGINERSICSIACNQVCPPDFTTSITRFQTDPPSTTASFDPNETEELAIPACRLGAGMLVDVAFGDQVLYFPSPLAVMFVLDNSGSMKAADVQCDNDAALDTRIGCLKLALRGSSNTAASFNGAAIARLLDSRPDGDIKVGIIEFGGDSRYRTFGGLTTRTCGTTSSTIPCYTRANYEAGADPARSTSSGMLTDTSSNRTTMRSVVNSLGGENGGTRAYLPLKQAKEILANTTAASKIIIFMSDGFSTDCCSYPGNACPVSAGWEQALPAPAYCSGAAGACNPPPGQQDCRYSHDEADAIKDDDVTIFTVSYPTLYQPMEDWATQTSGSSFSYSYAGADVAAMFDQIINAINLTVKVSNNASFSTSGSTNGETNWVESTILDEGYGIPLNVNLTRNNNRSYCQDDWRNVHVKTIFSATGSGADARVTLSNIRWSYCPLAGF